MLTRLLFIIAIPLMVIACNESSQSTAASNTDSNSSKTVDVAENNAASAADSAVTVNNIVITQAELNSYSSQRTRGTNYADLPKPQQEMLRDELINLELMAQEAVDSGVAEQPALKAQLALMRKELLARTYLQDWIKNNEPDEATLREFYDKRQAGDQLNEYKARHILVDDEALAADLITQLKGGAEFAELAKNSSKDGSAANGGDLGWFQASHMVKPFADAVKALENGQYSQAPVQSRFGYHVILREDSRAKAPPSFDSIRDELRGEAREAKIDAFVEQLRAKSDIKVKTEAAE